MRGAACCLGAAARPWVPKGFAERGCAMSMHVPWSVLRLQPRTCHACRKARLLRANGPMHIAHASLQILIVAAVVDLLIALASGEHGLGAFVEPGVIMLILVANGGCCRPTAAWRRWLGVCFAVLRTSLKQGPAAEWVCGVSLFPPSRSCRGHCRRHQMQRRQNLMTSRPLTSPRPPNVPPPPASRLLSVLCALPAATVGVITETNAEKAIEELKAYEADVATALRDGRWTVLPATGEARCGCWAGRKVDGCMGGGAEPACRGDGWAADCWPQEGPWLPEPAAVGCVVHALLHPPAGTATLSARVPSCQRSRGTWWRLAWALCSHVHMRRAPLPSNCNLCARRRRRAPPPPPSLCLQSWCLET